MMMMMMMMMMMVMMMMMMVMMVMVVMMMMMVMVVMVVMMMIMMIMMMVMMAMVMIHDDCVLLLVEQFLNISQHYCYTYVCDMRHLALTLKMSFCCLKPDNFGYT